MDEGDTVKTTYECTLVKDTRTDETAWTGILVWNFSEERRVRGLNKTVRPFVFNGKKIIHICVLWWAGVKDSKAHT